MPQAYVKKLAKKHGTSTNSAESKWKKAKASAKKQGQTENFAYVTSIFKKMMHEESYSGSFKDFLVLTERHNDESYDRGRMGDSFNFSSKYRDENDRDELEDIDRDEEDQFSDDEDFDEDQFGDDEDFGDEEDFDEDNIGGERGHRLADIVEPEDLNDEEDFDEDQFGDEEDFDEDQFGDEEDFDEDQFGDEEDFDNEDADLDDSLEYEGSNDREGDIDDEDEINFRVREDYSETTSLTFLGELMNLTEKKKVPLKKAAKKVYHRDYEKTKNKPYRKYHPESEYTERGKK